MKTNPIRTLALAATLPFIQTLSAQLPMLEQPWVGYFAIAEEGKFRFQMNSGGESGILVLKKGGEEIDEYPIALKFLATETLPDGSVRDLPMKLDTVESTDPPSAELKKTVFRGKLTDQATGQPTLEVTLEIASGTVLANARITDKGAFDRNPLRPVIRAGFPFFYGAEKVANENAQKEELDKKQIRELEKQIKELEKRIGKDSVTLKHLDGKTVKLACVAKPELKPNEINATGSSLVEVDIAAYQERKFEFLAAPNSSLTLGYTAPLPLHNGFYLQWSADPAKDPAGKAKLAIRIK